MVRLTPHFTYIELFKNLGDYVPSPSDVANIVNLLNFVLEPLRNYINLPIIINSGFRTIEHNSFVGGVPNSQHCFGMAVDFRVDVNKYPLYSPSYLCELINRLSLPYDQMILYKTFVHISYNPFGNNRKHFFKDSPKIVD